MHLTYNEIGYHDYSGRYHFAENIDLDEKFFYSAPTSFFVVDRRIPLVIRELITEAEGCAKMNHLTGASACTRKAIYELLRDNNAQGKNYDDKIKSIKSMFPSVDEELFEILGHIKDMTSDHVHEESWVAWKSSDLQLFLQALKAILQEIYVVPEERKARAQSVRALKEELEKAKQSGRKGSDDNN